jgi:hypothetical protein
MMTCLKPGSEGTRRSMNPVDSATLPLYQGEQVVSSIITL